MNSFYCRSMANAEWWYYFVLRLVDINVREQNYILAKNFLLSGLEHSKGNSNRVHQVSFVYFFPSLSVSNIIQAIFLLSLFQVSLLLWDLPGAIAIKQELETVVSTIWRVLFIFSYLVKRATIVTLTHKDIEC